MRDTAGEVETSSLMYSCGPLHMNKQRQDDQLEPTYSSAVPIRDVFLKTCRKQWTIERSGKRGSGISVLTAWHDDNIYIYCHPETDCFVESQLFRVARHVRHFKLGSKLAQLYVRPITYISSNRRPKSTREFNTYVLTFIFFNILLSRLH